MSFWGATVITSLTSAIFMVGDTIITWLWSGFSVDKAWNWYICHLRTLGQHTLNMFFVGPYVQIIPNWFEKLHDIHMQIYIGHVLVGVNPCARCTIVAPLPQIAELPRKSQNNGFKICELIWVGLLPIFWMRIIFCHLEMIWVEVWSKNQPWFNFKIVATQDHYWHSYYNLLHKKILTVKFGLLVVTPNLQTSIQLDLSKKLKIFSCGCWNWGHISLGKFEGNWAWEVRG